MRHSNVVHVCMSVSSHNITYQFNEQLTTCN